MDERCCVCRDRAAVDGDYCVSCGRLMGRTMPGDEESRGPSAPLDEMLARLEALQPGMALPLAAHLVHPSRPYWVLLYAAEGDEWAIADISGGTAEQQAQRAAYLVAAANALPALLAVARAAHAYCRATQADPLAHVRHVGAYNAMATALRALAAPGEGAG